MSLDESDIKKLVDLLHPGSIERNDAQVAANIAKETAVAVATHMSKQISELHEGLAVTNQKVDFMVNGLLEDRIVRNKNCEAHLNRIKSLEMWRTFLAGAWAVVCTMAYAAWDYIIQRGTHK